MRVDHARRRAGSNSLFPQSSIRMPPKKKKRGGNLTKEITKMGGAAAKEVTAFVPADC
jgi:hypothetical protein